MATVRFVARREFLKRTADAVLGLAASRMAFAAEPGTPPPKPEHVISPDAALERLMRGNARYVEGFSKRHDLEAECEIPLGGQNPYASILSCADSRIAPEYAFDAARGDLWVVEVDGNFANDDVIAGLEYGVAVFDVPLIMVLGHGSCGAVDATIKSVEGHTELPGHLPSLVNAIAPAVKAAIPQAGSLLDNAIRENVVLNVQTLIAAMPILREAVEEKRVRVVGGIYNLATGNVDLV